MKSVFSPIISSFLALALSAGIIAGCGTKEPQPEPEPSPTPTTVAVTGVTLDKTTLSLAEGSSETLTATVSPENASDKSVS
ncbi:MAG: Ig-like domain-containing protein [Bacteroidales bacterium]|nr:Ig-like domain-containing protein [Bacteroidales bacterium]